MTPLRSVAPALLVVTLVLTGCGSDDPAPRKRDAAAGATGGMGGTGGGGVGGMGGNIFDAATAPDAVRDTAGFEIVADRDAGALADLGGADLARDGASPDAIRDAGIDQAASPDVGLDASQDAGVDAPVDGGVDVSPDVAADLPAPDTSPDLSPDASPDGSPDVGTAPFMNISPCASEGVYQTSPTTITFRVGPSGYTPPCLKISKGSTVTFSGTFGSHPLQPRAGGTAGNPITFTSSGDSHAFTFNQAGFFPYHCNFHGDMIGVIWVIE